VVGLPLFPLFSGCTFGLVVFCGRRTWLEII